MIIREAAAARRASRDDLQRTLYNVTLFIVGRAARDRSARVEGYRPQDAAAAAQAVVGAGAIEIPGTVRPGPRVALRVCRWG